MTIADIFNITFPSQFGTDEDDNETEAICDVYSQLNGSVTTAFGASKFIIFLNDNEVVKVPFNGEFYTEYFDDEDETGYSKFDYFCTEDYCMVEAAVYADAIAAGVDIFFASTEFVGNTLINKTPIYLSERVLPFDYLNNEERSYSRDSYSKAGKMCGRCPVEWTAMALEYYGEEAVRKLFDFIEKEGIDDLHWGNVGIRRNGAPVLLDYSGFSN